VLGHTNYRDRERATYDYSVSSSCQESPLALLMQVADRLRQIFVESAAAVGLTESQAHIIAQLEEPVRMGSIAQMQTCDPSSVTTMMHRLERDGFVKRIVDSNDARARLVQLTAKGRRARAKFFELVGDGASVLDSLTDEQRLALAQLFALDR
jgi:DNA-binding MarR family transcriptional regulator